MQPYHDLLGFEDLYLEDSFVLDVVARPGSLMFAVDIVLRESHPDYQPPRRGEQYSYRRGRITLGGVKRLTWLAAGIQPAEDSTGEMDWGGFDEFALDGKTYVLSGDFGKLQVEAATCTVELDN